MAKAKQVPQVSPELSLSAIGGSMEKWTEDSKDEKGVSEPLGKSVSDGNKKTIVARFKFSGTVIIAKVDFSHIQPTPLEPQALRLMFDGYKTILTKKIKAQWEIDGKQGKQKFEVVAQISDFQRGKTEEERALDSLGKLNPEVRNAAIAKVLGISADELQALKDSQAS